MDQKSLATDLNADETALPRPLSASLSGITAGSPKAAQSPTAAPKVARVEPAPPAGAGDEEPAGSPSVPARTISAAPSKRRMSDAVPEGYLRPVTVPVDTRLAGKHAFVSRTATKKLEPAVNRSADALAARRGSTQANRDALRAAHSKARRESLAKQYASNDGIYAEADELAHADELGSLLNASRS